MKVLSPAVLAVLCAAVVSRPVPAAAQAAEASVLFGYTLSEGITAQSTRIINGNFYNDADPKSSFSWGFTVGFFVSPNAEVEFLYDRQITTLNAANPGPSLDLADMNVDNYHANFVYNWGEPGASMRPFAFGGLGATSYGFGTLNSNLPAIAGAAIDGETQFSSTWGGGVKFYPGKAVGFKLQARWTPTYIKSDPGGLWCDPYYPTCWVLADPDYSNQFELSAGVTLRFGEK